MTGRALLGLALLALAACDGRNEGGGLQGYVEGDYLQMAAADAGWVEAVLVGEGATVAAGAPLFRLEASRERAAVAQARAELAKAEAELADLRKGERPEEIAAREAQVAEAEAVLELAELTLKRQERLAKRDVAAEARFDEARAEAAEAKARLARMRAELASARLPARADRVAMAEAAAEAARAALDQAEWRLDQRAIASPCVAIVDEIVHHAGEWVAASGTVINLLPPTEIKVVFFIPEGRRAGFADGDVLRVGCTGCAAGLEARVSFLAPEAEYTPPVIYSEQTRAKLVFRAEAKLVGEPAALLPGQPVTVEAAS